MELENTKKYLEQRESNLKEKELLLKLKLSKTENSNNLKVLESNLNNKEVLEDDLMENGLLCNSNDSNHIKNKFSILALILSYLGGFATGIIRKGILGWIK